MSLSSTCQPTRRAPLRRAIIIAACALALPLAAHAADLSARPKLVVVVSIDQFRGDYIRRFDPWFGDDGFRRIEREGFDFNNCMYASANTETGPGHSTMLTGTYGHRSGIVANDFYDVKDGRVVYCVSDSATSPVTNAGYGRSRGGSVSPRRLISGTTGDNLEAATGGHAKTVSLSLKDRAAILMGGHAADVALWWDHGTGQFVSSSYYGKALPEWARTFNDGHPADQWFHKNWELSLPAENYAKVCTPDDVASENFGAGRFTSARFPHQLGARSQRPDGNYYESIYNSPFGNDLLLQLVRAAIPGEGLGQDDVPDLLTVSFSVNDPIGHAFGPDSWEVMDATIKTDRVIGELMKTLDETVGKGEWTLLLTADHGVADMPEVLRDEHIPAERVSGRRLSAGLETRLHEVAGPPANSRSYLIDMGVPWVTFNPAALHAGKTDERATLAEAAAEWLRQQPGVALAMTEAEVQARGATADSDSLIHSIWLTDYRGRAGDVAFVLDPNDLLGDGNSGTSHGTPYHYDQYVPLLAIGKGIRHGRSSVRVQPPQIAPTAAVLLGVVPPNLCEVPPLDAALEQ